MTVAILDASALLALLLGEPGGERVQAVLAGSAMCSVNLCEVVGHFARNGVAETDVRRVLGPLPIEHHPFDGELAYSAGLLVPLTKAAGLSFGDRACLALAQRLGLAVLTADRAWRGMAEAIGVEIDLIR